MIINLELTKMYKMIKIIKKKGFERKGEPNHQNSFLSPTYYYKQKYLNFSQSNLNCARVAEWQTRPSQKWFSFTRSTGSNPVPGAVVKLEKENKK